MHDTANGHGSPPNDRERRRHLLHGVSRRVILLYSAAVGILAGILAVAFQKSVEAAERLSILVGQTVGHSTLLIAGFAGASAVIAGIASYLVGRFAPEAGGSGIPHIKAALLHLRIIRPIRIIVAKFLGGLAALAVRMSLGREGPTVKMGASLGKLMGVLLKAPKRSRGALVSAGAGAGLAAAFNAPLAGFIFVMEELKREMSPITYGTALVASVCSVAVTRYLLGQEPSFHLPNPAPPPLVALAPIAVFGILAGIAGVAFNRALLASLALRTKLKAPRWLAGLVVGALSGILLLKF